MTRGFILLERERERERVRACVCVCMRVHVRARVLYYNTKLWTQFYISDLLGYRDASEQSAHLRNLIRLFFFHISFDKDVPKTHTGFRKYKQTKKKLHVAGYYNAEISLHKAIRGYLSVSNIYIALSIKIPFLTSLFQNLWYHSLMNVLFNSYHVTVIPSLNQSTGCLT